MRPRHRHPRRSRHLTGLAVLAVCHLVRAASVTGGEGAIADVEKTFERAAQIDLGYSAEVLAVVHGGVQRGAVFRGLTDAAVQLDLARWVGRTGTVFRLSALHPHGGNLSGTHVGDLQGASNIEAWNQPVLFELWGGGTIAHGRVLWRTGRLAADGDFATTESGGVFLNSSFGWPAFISANTLNTGPAFPRSALGAFTRIELSENFHVQAGVYDGDSFDDPGGDSARHANGLHVELGHGQGRLTLIEFSVTRPDSQTTGAACPGTLKIGAWQHTASFADQSDPNRNHSGNYGFYAAAEQRLWRESGDANNAGRGLTAFARTGSSPANRNLVSRAWDFGLSFTGLLPGRHEDVTALGSSSVWISRDRRRAERRAGLGIISDVETVVELSHQFVAHRHWQLTPNLQWVRHPGGSAALPDAFVLGLRTRFAY